MTDHTGQELTPKGESEDSLATRLRAGDPDAFATLVAKYAKQLAQFACYIVRSRDTAEDIVQQVFVELWERRSIAIPDQLKPYLFRSVRNNALKELRHQGVRERYRVNIEVASETSAVVQSPEGYILTTTAIQTAVEQLSERRRFAIRLRLEYEMTHLEIAEVLGVSPMAAQRLVARAMADLRDLLWERIRPK